MRITIDIDGDSPAAVTSSVSTQVSAVSAGPAIDAGPAPVDPEAAARAGVGVDYRPAGISGADQDAGPAPRQS